jgi:hypothetical protein
VPSGGVEASPEGEHAPEFRARSASWIRTRTPRFVRWIVLLFIASLAIPALTKQWSDRKQELQVKESLSTDISKVSADAVYGALFAVSQSAAEQRSSRRQAINDWLRSRATIDPRFVVYFSRSDAADHWFAGGRERRLGFRNALLIYVLMACCDEHRSKHAARLRSYLPSAVAPVDLADPWGVLACDGQKSCLNERSYYRAYMWLGNQLLGQRRVLLDELLHANGTGFSSGWHDFIDDLNPLG